MYDQHKDLRREEISSNNNKLPLKSVFRPEQSRQKRRRLNKKVSCEVHERAKKELNHERKLKTEKEKKITC